MMTICYAVLVLGGIGAVSGALLAVFNKLFSVPAQHKVADIREALPGINCGRCGFPGCEGFAQAVAGGQASANGCPVGRVALAERIAQILNE